jgi:hypothetical protein
MSKAITPFRASDLQHLLDLAEHRRNGALTRVGSVPRGVLEILREMTEIFEGAHLDFALADALALSFYAPARETADIAFVCLDSQRKDIKNALQEAGFRVVQGNLPYQMTFKDPRSKIEIHILLGAVDPEESAASIRSRLIFLGCLHSLSNLNTFYGCTACRIALNTALTVSPCSTRARSMCRSCVSTSSTLRTLLPNVGSMCLSSYPSEKLRTKVTRPRSCGA